MYQTVFVKNLGPCKLARTNEPDQTTLIEPDQPDTN